MIITYNPKFLFRVPSHIFHVSQIFHKTVKHYKTVKCPKTSQKTPSSFPMHIQVLLTQSITI